jgi:DNA helicase-2/ATP-dependent DNA helicase PcrA
MPFQDAPDSQPRGLAPSKIAVLLRSVRHNGDLIVGALQDEGLPVVVVGMAGLFKTSEAQAAAGIFHYMAQGISEDALKDLWRDADVGIDEADLSTAVAQLTESRRFQHGQRYGIYNLQLTFMTFLETIRLREESIPGGRGEIVFYNLGKFSQVISDFEQIHFQSDPKTKYERFSGFLTYQAPDYYPEGWQDVGYAKPDAVQVMTVHQAKGMEWPVVFVPCMQKNRFPAPKMGGKGRWHVIPRETIPNAGGNDGSIEYERLLFYVALTRSKNGCSAPGLPTRAATDTRGARNSSRNGLQARMS